VYKGKHIAQKLENIKLLRIASLSFVILKLWMQIIET